MFSPVFERCTRAVLWLVFATDVITCPGRTAGWRLLALPTEQRMGVEAWGGEGGSGNSNFVLGRAG